LALNEVNGAHNTAENIRRQILGKEGYKTFDQIASLPSQEKGAK